MWMVKRLLAFVEGFCLGGAGYIWSGDTVKAIIGAALIWISLELHEARS